MHCKPPLGSRSRRAEERGLLLDAATSSGANVPVTARWTTLPGGGKRWERLKTVAWEITRSSRLR